VDVSEGGLCVELGERASRGETITGKIQVEGRRVPFSGRIAWVEPPRGATRRRRVGVQFTKAPPALRDIFMAASGAPQPA
jgi:Tfp pilus assembly protein PilZ